MGTHGYLRPTHGEGCTKKSRCCKDSRTGEQTGKSGHPSERRERETSARMRDRVSEKTDLVEIFSWVSISHGLSRGVVQLHVLHVSRHYSCSCSTSFRVLTGPICLRFPAHKCPSLSQILSLS